MRVLITGADGFIGNNLRQHLAERSAIEIRSFTRANHSSELAALLQGVDYVFHLAGINRPQHPQEFITGNSELTQHLAQALCAIDEDSGHKTSVIYASSTQAAQDNPYGQSKRAAEQALFAARDSHNLPLHVFRLPNVFGKWARPNYNSAIATFCYNIAHGLPIHIHDANAPLTLVYVDDLVRHFLHLLDGGDIALDAHGFASVIPQYTSTVGAVARHIEAFKNSRSSLLTERVGTGLVRALYATYMSYLTPQHFAYKVPQHQDTRGTFVEMLKTPDCGQFSYFTAHPGVTRGGHYHHSKTEKFLVIKGQARFRFRNLSTGETYELITSGDQAQIVETVPGWVHDITNVGAEEMLVMLWANEVFDRAQPDTFAGVV